MNVFGPLTKKHDGMQILCHLRHVMKQTISYCTLGPIRNRRYFAFSWMKMYGLWLNFHWSLFPNVQLTISQHWFRLWSGADQETLSEPILVRLPTHICATGLNELMNITHSAWLYVTCDLNSLWPRGLVKMGHFYHHIDVTEVLAISRRFGGRLWIFIGAHGLLRVLTFNF